MWRSARAALVLLFVVGTASAQPAVSPAYTPPPPATGSAFVPLSQYRPAAVWDGTGWLTVWPQRNRLGVFGIRGQHFDTSNAAVQPQGYIVAQNPGTLFSTPLACGAAGCLVTWLELAGPAGRIMGQRLVGGAGVGPTFVVNAVNQNPLAVGWTGSTYVVLSKTSSSRLNLSRVTPTGVALDPDGGTQTSERAFQNQGMACHDGECLVVWDDINGGGRFQVFGGRFMSDGGWVGDAGIVVDLPARESYDPDVAWNGSIYLVAFLGQPVSGMPADIRVMRLSVDGARLDATPIVLSTNHDANGTHLAVTAEGNDFRVAWATSLRGTNQPFVATARVSASGAIIEPAHQVQDGGASIAQVSVTSGPDASFIVSQLTSSGDCATHVVQYDGGVSPPHPAYPFPEEPGAVALSGVDGGLRALWSELAQTTAHVRSALVGSAGLTDFAFAGLGRPVSEPTLACRDGRCLGAWVLRPADAGAQLTLACPFDEGAPLSLSTCQSLATGSAFEVAAAPYGDGSLVAYQSTAGVLRVAVLDANAVLSRDLLFAQGDAGLSALTAVASPLGVLVSAFEATGSTGRVWLFDGGAAAGDAFPGSGPLGIACSSTDCTYSQCADGGAVLLPAFGRGTPRSLPSSGGRCFSRVALACDDARCLAAWLERRDAGSDRLVAAAVDSAGTGFTPPFAFGSGSGPQSAATLVTLGLGRFAIAYSEVPDPPSLPDLQLQLRVLVFDDGGSDAGTPDAGTSDAGTSDAGTSDAGTGDAGPDGPADGGLASSTLTVACGCSGLPSDALLLLAALALRRRRATAPRAARPAAPA